MPDSRRQRFRALLAAPGLIIAPGAYDALSARLIEQAGFDVVYMTGSGAANSLLGQPDLGLTTMTEMAGQAARISAARPTKRQAPAPCSSRRPPQWTSCGRSAVRFRCR